MIYELPRQSNDGKIQGEADADEGEKLVDTNANTSRRRESANDPEYMTFFYFHFEAFFFSDIHQVLINCC